VGTGATALAAAGLGLAAAAGLAAGEAAGLAAGDAAGEAAAAAAGLAAGEAAGLAAGEAAGEAGAAGLAAGAGDAGAALGGGAAGAVVGAGVGEEHAARTRLAPSTAHSETLIESPSSFSRSASRSALARGRASTLTRERGWPLYGPRMVRRLARRRGPDLGR
jgi:hypothetical protein